MKFVGAGKSDVGRVRSGNEDAFLVDHGRALFAVADGMGGHQAGEIASHTAIETLRAEFDADEDIADAITQANRAVYTKAHSNVEWEGMGTTLTAVAIVGRLAIVGHVGDSRTYLLRDGKLRRVTDDHSLVEQLVREGRLTREQAANHPQRSIITRALGVSSKVQVDTNHVHLHDKDRFLLCSDGLTSMVDDDSLAEVLRKNRDPKRAVSRLIDLANHAGGEDNITAVVLDIQIDPGDPSGGLDTTGTIDLSGGITITQPSRKRRRRQAPSGDPSGGTDAPTLDATTQIHNSDNVGTAPIPITRPDPEPQPDVALNLADVPAAPPTPPAPAVGGKVAKSRSRSRIILGGLGVTALVLAILGIAYWAVSWYASSNYYVDATDGNVVIYQGTPGGFLTWDPEVVEVTDLTVSELSPATQQMVNDQREFDSLDKAEAFVDRLAEQSAADNATPSTMVSTTSSTQPFIPGVTPPLGATTTTTPASNPAPTMTTVP